MQIIVLGASGYIGLSVSQALIRAGHVVYGQTRSAEKARQLAAEEIIPIVGEAHDVKSFESLLATTDVVIDTSSGNDANSIAVLAGLTAAAQSVRHAYAPKLTLVYCSGAWVHGDSRTEYVTDSTPAIKPVPLTAWRATREQEIVKSQVLNGIVVRPSMLYGRSGSTLVPLFKSAHEGKVIWFGTPGARFPMIHQDDLADFFLKVVEKSPHLGGMIFDASNPNTESVVDVLERLVQVSGASDYTFVKPSNAFEEALATTVLLRPYLGRTLLGWHPVKASFVDGMETWYAAYKASAGLQ